MADIDSIFATVKNCQKVGSAEIDGANVSIFRVRAEMDAPRNRYAGDIYLVKILEPSRLDTLLPEMGAPMDHEEFEFDSTEAVSEGTKLKISVSK